jgi:hypothetical protein
VEIYLLFGNYVLSLFLGSRINQAMFAAALHILRLDPEAK